MKVLLALIFSLTSPIVFSEECRLTPRSLLLEDHEKVSECHYFDFEKKEFATVYCTEKADFRPVYIDERFLICHTEVKFELADYLEIDLGFEGSKRLFSAEAYDDLMENNENLLKRLVKAARSLRINKISLSNEHNIYMESQTVKFDVSLSRSKKIENQVYQTVVLLEFMNELEDNTYGELFLRPEKFNDFIKAFELEEKRYEYIHYYQENKKVINEIVMDYDIDTIILGDKVEIKAPRSFTLPMDIELLKEFLNDYENSKYYKGVKEIITSNFDASEELIQSYRDFLTKKSEHQILFQKYAIVLGIEIVYLGDKRKLAPSDGYLTINVGDSDKTIEDNIREMVKGMKFVENLKRSVSRIANRRNLVVDYVSDMAFLYGSDSQKQRDYLRTLWENDNKLMRYMSRYEFNRIDFSISSDIFVNKGTLTMPVSLKALRDSLKGLKRKRNRNYQDKKLFYKN